MRTSDHGSKATEVVPRLRSPPTTVAIERNKYQQVSSFDGEEFRCVSVT